MLNSMLPKKVFFIDDDLVIHHLIDVIVQRYSPETELTPFQSGGQVIAKDQLCPPDLVLIDYNLSDMNGLDVYNHLMTRSGFSDVPFIFLTGQSNFCPQKDMITNNIKGVILKPFRPKELLSQIAELIDSTE